MTNRIDEHTPGPWSYSVYDGSNHCKIYLHGLGRADHIKGSDSLQGYCGEANARLIAAAPQLLEKLEKLMGIVENNRLADYDEFREVIAKARGRGEIMSNGCE
jgi:hypothetical protein